MYQLLELLSSRSPYRIYRARDERFERTVLLKISAAVPSDDRTARASLGREARVMAACAHPAILQVYSFDEFKGRPCLAMEYSERGNLAQNLHRAWPLDAAVGLVNVVAYGLDHIHAHGIAHNRVNVNHIFVGNDGRPKIGSFGAARIDDTREALKNDLRGLCGVLEALLSGSVTPQLPGEPTRANSLDNGLIAFPVLAQYLGGALIKAPDDYKTASAFAEEIKFLGETGTSWRKRGNETETGSF
jgi:serine/threonine protein kinase